MHNINVTKRDGSLEPLDLNKIHKVLKWATEGLADVSISDIEIKSNLQFYPKIPTSKIHEVLIETAAKLVSEEHPDYQYVASKLVIMKIRKDIYNDIIPPALFDVINENVNIHKVYDPDILLKYSKEEIDYFNMRIDHDRDYNLAYIGVAEFTSKYLVQNRVTKQLYETPQIAYMLISMVAFMEYEPEQRKRYVIDFYNALSNFDISLPTPIMAGLRTCAKQYSSCVLLDCGDSLDSISATADAVLQYASRRAGLGINVGRLRAVGSSIRNGEAYSTGLIPFIKLFESTVKSCSQGNLRKSSATLNYPIWHLEFEELVVMRNSAGTDETRARSLDYCVQINRLFYERLQKKDNITLFSPDEVPGLYEAFFSDQDKFRELYCKYEKDKKIRKKIMSAEEVFGLIIAERIDSGRLYIMNVDHCNEMGTFKEKECPVYMTNLCCEITLCTEPLSRNEEVGSISLCTLAGVNLGNVKQYKDMEYPVELLVRCLDSVLSYQQYPLKASERVVKLDRALGVGVINYAYYLAKNKLMYGSQEALDETHRLFEHMQYYLLKASNKLAQEFGKCDGFKRSKYSEGILPIDKYKKSLDEVVNIPLMCDWHSLKQDILKHGLRNNTLSTIMPSESSSKVSSSTNGVEAVRKHALVKSSKNSSATFIAPELKKYKKYYPIAFDIEQEDYLKTMAVIQKFVDQSISTNIYYDPRKFEGGQISLTKVKRDLLIAYKYGIKTLYYSNNIPDEVVLEVDLEKESGCAGGSCSL